MASYIHTCTTCGVKMTVHDRYYGRALRCRECRAEFIADPGAPGGPPARGVVPSSTSHTCTACGASMTVPERYYGRSLRCTGCGEPFTARLPVAAAAAQVPAVAPAAPVPPTRPTAPAPAPPDPAARSRRVQTLAVVGVVAVVLGALLWWLGGNREQGFGSSLFRAEKQRTQIGVLRLGDVPMVPVALDREAFDRLLAAAADPAALQAFRESASCLSLPAGTRVRVLERRKRSAEAQVRILDGPQSGRIVWVPISWVR